ncbi:peptidylprolyl isomerase [Patescibacteria group bacterium]|nr:peptidylprolyl isomerase [Patescibacteria group bacterium]MBU1906842.1 peptidylprolyl isomerase [Patescibacteria group bacterium]
MDIENTDSELHRPVLDPVAPPMTEEPKSKPKARFSVMHLSLIMLGLALLFMFGVATVVVYRTDPTSEAVRSIVRIVPYPAAMVNGHAVGYQDVLSSFDGLNTFYLKQSTEFGGVVPDQSEMIENILNNLIRTEIIASLAKDRGIVVDPVEVDKLMDQAVADAGGSVEEFNQMIADNYGWDSQDFRSLVLEPLMLATNLQEAIVADTELQADRRAIAQAALDRINNGEDFATVASEVSEDQSGMDGGDIGYITPGAFGDPVWDELVFSMEPGQVSEVLDADQVFGILRVEEILGSSETDNLQAKVSVIIVSKRVLEDVVNEEIASAKIWKLIQI